MDYGSVMWYPIGRKEEMKALEEPLHSFKRKVKAMKDLTYSQRLSRLKMLSIERITEKYMLLYIWKSVNGFLPSLGLSWSGDTDRRSGNRLIIEAVRGKVLSAKTLKMH